MLAISSAMNRLPQYLVNIFMLSYMLILQYSCMTICGVI